MIKAIETEYKGYRFRSRLEARWAVFFDALGITWEYEKEGYDLGEAGWYLPDFWLPEFKCFVEIKGADCSDEDRAKCEALHHESEYSVFIAQGNIGDHQWIEFGGYWVERKIELPLDKAQDFHYWIDKHQTGFDSLFVCPVCRNTYVHITNNDGAIPPILSLECEGGHSWELHTWNSKGHTYLRVKNATEWTHTRPEIAWGANDTTCLNAITAARHARFEHGERGTR